MHLHCCMENAGWSSRQFVSFLNYPHNAFVQALGKTANHVMCYSMAYIITAISWSTNVALTHIIHTLNPDPAPAGPSTANHQLISIANSTYSSSQIIYNFVLLTFALCPPSSLGWYLDPTELMPMYSIYLVCIFQFYCWIDLALLTKCQVLIDLWFLLQININRLSTNTKLNCHSLQWC